MIHLFRRSPHCRTAPEGPCLLCGAARLEVEAFSFEDQFDVIVNSDVVRRYPWCVPNHALLEILEVMTP